ncbi:autophagy-related protein 2 homolog A-like [Agelaius tricolor]|uniref:autophagy-related protein 2 homolog A-like n=1 Tax=Agelaius tricolor TaxID=9191 RepID=UPI0039F1DB44
MGGSGGSWGLWGAVGHAPYPLAVPRAPADPPRPFRGPAGGSGPAAPPPGAAPPLLPPGAARPQPHLGPARGAGLRQRPRPRQTPPPQLRPRPPAVALPGGPREGPGAADGAVPGQGVPAARVVPGRARGVPGGAPGGGVLGPGEAPTSRLVLLVPELELRDRLGGGSAPPFLSRHPRGAPPPQPPTLWLKALRVLPQPPPPGGVPECCLRVTLTPLRLHIDQDALIFLRDFAGAFLAHLSPPPGPPPGPPPAPPGVGDPPRPEPPPEPEAETETETETPPIYFREFRFTADVPVWLDYRGKRVTMEQGALAGILIGLARLNCSQLRLKRLCHRQGLLGLSRVVSYAVTEWLRDIRCHQLPGLLGGVAPVHAVLRLWRALRDLLLLPLQGGGPGGVTLGVTRGVTRGVTALGAAGASAALGLGARLLRALQALAEALFGLVAPPGPPRLPPGPPHQRHPVRTSPHQYAPVRTSMDQYGPRPPGSRSGPAPTEGLGGPRPPPRPRPQ